MQKTATTYLLLITFVAAIGGFLFGYDWVTPMLRQYWFQCPFNRQISPVVAGK